MITSNGDSLNPVNLIVQWDKKFEIGIEKIDQQHKTLVELCGKLYFTLMNEDRKNPDLWKTEFVQALKECVNYVKFHFSSEEECMKSCSYPDLAHHKTLHVAFTKKVLETAKQFENPRKKDAVDFVKFLYDWIFQHIAHEDKLFVKYMK